MDTTTLKIRTSIAGNLDLFSEGDVAFRRELKELMVKDLEELRESLNEIPNGGDASAFNNTVHKVKVTLEILNQGEFFKLIDDITAVFTFEKRPALATKLREFYVLCGCLIVAIQEESFA